MNKKKIILTGTITVLVALGAGIAYYFYPAAINALLGIDAAQVNIVPDGDGPVVDDASSSLLTVDSATDANDTASPLPSVKKTNTKKVANGGSGTREAQNDTAQGTKEVLSSPERVETSSKDSAAAILSCTFPSGTTAATKKVLINEIAWMGSPSSSNAEWIELKNSSTNTIDLSGWRLIDAAEKIKVSFIGGDAIAPGGFLLLTRGSGGMFSASASVPAKTYSGDLTNTGDTLALIDAQCDPSDYLDASGGWPGGNNMTKATLERGADGTTWHTSAAPGGTPGAENSAGPPPAPVSLVVNFEGNASGAVIASDPIGLSCSSAGCIGSFTSGTRVTLTPTAGPSGTFIGWSGMCDGEAMCSFTIVATTTIIAEFNATPPTQASNASTEANSSLGFDTGSGVDISDNPNISPLATSTTTSSVLGHVLIAAVQIAGAATNNDLVKLFNPTGAPIDMSGWKLHKRSQTGADYSLKTLPSGSTIAAGQWFIWANSENGFSEAAGANVSSTETLSANNSVALMDATGNVIDAVAWGTGTGQYGEGPPFPTSPGANQMLSRRSSGGVMADTGDNGSDFTIQ